MINPHELRIGNLVYESNSFTPEQSDYSTITVAVINDIEKVIRDSRDNIYSYDAIYHIPLTPELLEKCGYIKDSTDKRFYNPGTSLPPLYFIQSGYYYMVGLPLNGNKFKHLHQLQNLIFALFGEELEIKL